MRRRRSWTLASPVLVLLILAARPAAAEDKMLCDFEDEGGGRAWSNIDVDALRQAEAKALQRVAAPAAKPPAATPPEPPVKIEWITEGPARGHHAMKLTFAGGRFPTVGAKLPPVDWLHYRSFRADVTAGHDCMVIFRAVPKTGNHLTGYNDCGMRWEFAARLSAGENHLAAPKPNYAENRWKGAVALEIYMVAPKQGESIAVSNIHLSTEPPKSTSAYNEAAQWPKDGFQVAGTGLVVKNADDLGDRLKLKETWVKPEEKTVEQVEAEMRAQFDQIKKGHPRAVLAMLRQGQKGYDPANPDREYAGWQCGYSHTHLPMALAMTCSINAGKVDRCEASHRGRPSFHRVDLSSIPQGSRILAARLIAVRSSPDSDTPPWNNWKTRPTLVVTEPVNRPWKECEVTVFQYAKDKFWKDFAGQCWGEDGDCAAVYLSHGPGSGKVNSWDFTHAVRYWTDGRQPNHGFILSAAPIYFDALIIFTYRCKELKNRPCVAVIYEPQP